MIFTRTFASFFHVYGFQLLKIVQKYGDIEKFDLLFHRSGPLAGKSRGYSFVSYKNEQDAQNAMNHLNGMRIGAKHVCVKYANTVSKVSLNADSSPIEAVVSFKTCYFFCRFRMTRALETTRSQNYQFCQALEKHHRRSKY